MLLNQTDIDFILAQLTLPGNDPRRALNGLGTTLDPSGIRDVGGVGNNVNNPGWGAVDQAFARLTTAGWTNAQGQLSPQFAPLNTPTSYAVRDVNLWDSTPRTISNLVANQSAAALSAIGYTTAQEQKLAVLDDPMTTPGGRVSPLTGNMNPLPYSGFMTLFGQFFDHGLDFVHKGSDGAVMVPILPGDPLYNHPDNAIVVDNQIVGYKNFIMASRTNTIHVQIGEETTNTLLTALGIAETTAGEPGSQTAVTGTEVLANSFSGVLMINRTAIELAPNTTRQGLLDAINDKSSTTGVVAYLSPDNKLVLTPPTIKVNIDELSTDALTGEFGFAETPSLGGVVTSTNSIAAVIVNAGDLVINGVAIQIAAGTTRSALVDTINANLTNTGITASLDGSNRLVLTPQYLHESVNTISPFIDLSQSYGSDPSKTAFVREYDSNMQVTGNLVSGDGNVGATGMSTWLAIKVNAARLGIILHDVNVTDTPMVRLNADGSVFIGEAGTIQEGGWLVARDVQFGQVYYVKDSYIAGNVNPGDVLNADGTTATVDLTTLRLQTVGHAFLDDMAHGVLNGTMNAAGDLDDPTLLNAHIIAGDGRANENLGLTSIHEIFHAEHNRALQEIISFLTPNTLATDINIGAASTNALTTALGLAEINLANTLSVTGSNTVTTLNAGTLVINGTSIAVGANTTLDQLVTAINLVKDTTGVAANNTAGKLHLFNQFYQDTHGNAWTGEMLFQAAKLVTEMEYQHLVFGEFARKLSPNINAFAAYDVTIDPAITAEFAHAVYRFGHSMLTETVDMRAFDAAGLAISGDAGDNSMGLIAAFLNPTAYTATTAGEVALGMGAQVANGIDEWVTDALRNNLVGLPLDLATLNMVRGRDTGMASLNAVRADLYAQTGDELLKPYDNWLEFGQHLLHPESLVNFIMAYARDAVIAQFDSVEGIQVGDIAAWNALQTSNPSEYNAKLRLAAEAALNDADGSPFLLSNTGLNDVDFWLGGLAEAKVAGGMLGSTFDFIFAMQMISLQNSDRFYYLNRLAGTDLLLNIEGQLFSDIVSRNTGVNHLYTDIFSVADSYVEMSANPNDGSHNVPLFNVNNVSTQDILGANVKVGKAGWIGDTFYGNTGNYLDARGVLNPNGTGNASEMIGGTSAANKINAAGGNDTVWGDEGNDTIEGGAGNDFLHGGTENDRITDSEGDDLIWGDEGDDTIQAGGGIDQVFGDEGNDTVDGGLGGDVMDGGAGNDVIYGDNGAVTNRLFKGVTITVMDANGDADIISGGDGDDIIFGGGGADGIDGGEGDDTIYGGVGADGLVGWTGNDTFVMDADDLGFANIVDGGEGFDTVDYSASMGNGVGTGAARQGININLSNIGPAVVPGVALAPQITDSYLSIEGAVGSAYNDTIVGGASVLGNTGLQTNALGVAINFGTALLPVFRPMDFVLDGGAGNDSIVGGDGNDILIGGTGNDSMTGGLGDDAYFVGQALDVVTEAALGGTDEIITTLGSYTLGAEIENLSFDSINGTGPFSGTGNAANNIITGGQGNDTLDGAAGVDTLVGGNGNDTYVVNSTTDVIIESADGGSDTISANISFSLLNVSNIENLHMSAGGTGTGNDSANMLTSNGTGNSLVGNGGNDTLNGGGGNDTLNGGFGRDVFLYSGAATTANLGTDLIQDFTRGEDLIDLSGITGITGGFTFIGTSAFTADAANQIRLNIAGNTTTIQIDTNNAAGAEMSITLQGVLALDATDFSSNVTGTGNAPNGTPATPTAGNDLLSASAGIDTTIDALAGSDVVFGNTGDDTLSGGAGNDMVTGGAGNDTVNGDAGNDNLMGDAGNDILNGGAGLDIMTGGAGADAFVLNTTLNRTTNVDTISDFSSADGDKINLENAIFARLTTPGGLAAGSFVTGTVARQADDYIIYDQVNGRLYYDADGSGRGASVLFATLTNKATLTANDFVVI
jgi:Ca2+-binding RTX toxin-like protein